jgi:hypothetical protein
MSFVSLYVVDVNSNCQKWYTFDHELAIVFYFFEYEKW